MGAEANSGRQRRRRVAIWDMPTRLFHWVVVLLFIALWITGTDGPLDWHIPIGEALLALLLFRLAWGIVGSRHSRFSDFVVGPRAAWQHAHEMLRVALRGAAGAPPEADAAHAPHAGHTRIGGWMILVLLALLLAQSVSGLFASDEITTDGPLTHLVSGHAERMFSDYHSIAFNVLLALIAVHIAAALFYLVRKRENLILPMITGRAELPETAAASEGRFASGWLALALLAVAVAIVWAAVTLL